VAPGPLLPAPRAVRDRVGVPAASPAVAAGSAGATPELLVALRPALLRYARRQVRDTAAAEDLVQSTLLAAWQGLRGFRGQAALLTWATGILKRKLADYRRRLAREAALADAGDTEAAPPDAMFDGRDHWLCPPQPWAEPEACCERAEFLQVLASCLARLPPRAARVFVMREVLELDAAAVCAELSITRANYWVLMHRARLRLRESLAHDWGAPERTDPAAAGGRAPGMCHDPGVARTLP
jgi:RNA polymerase sigma-70 factor (ECF subfamily)